MSRRTLPVAWIGVLLVGLGCAQPSVELESVEGFDGLNSSIWLRLQEPDGGTETFDAIVLSTAGDLCSRLQDALPAYKELLDDEGLSDADQLAQGAPLFDDLMAAGHRAVFVTLYDGIANDSWNAKLVPGEWTLDEESGEIFGVDLRRFRDNPLAAAADDVTDKWFAVAPSSLLLEEAAGDAISGEANGELVGEDDEPAGDFEISFRAPYCEVVVESDVVWGLFLF